MFLKIFFASLTAFQLPTAFFVSNAPNQVNYTLTTDMIKSISTADFNNWSNIPWTSAYFDLDQSDLKITAANVVSNFTNYGISFASVTAGVPQYTDTVTQKVYNFTEKDINSINSIFFNHNYISKNQYNYMLFERENAHAELDLNFKLSILKPLSFYVKSFLFTLGSTGNFPVPYKMIFSFLDYNGKTQYNFTYNSTVNFAPNTQNYNFVTLPVQIPNLKELDISFNFIQAGEGYPSVSIGQMNIFSQSNLVPIPPDSPFSPQYEKVAWYDIFGQLRNFFRWCLYGVIGSVLPIKPLQEFCENLDKLLREIFDDTLGSVLQVDIVTPIENIIPLWLFIRIVAMILG